MRSLFAYLVPLYMLPLGIGLGGCLPAEARFDWGVGTHEVVGRVEPAEPVGKLGDVLIVAFQRHYLLETMEREERFYTVTARLQSVDREGRFSIPMPSDVVSLDILFIAPDHFTKEFRFNRQIGIGQVTYHAALPYHPKWRSHFFTYLQPILSHLIVEKRFRLSREDQLRLSDWLLAQQERLDALRTRPDGDSAPAPESESPGEP